MSEISKEQLEAFLVDHEEVNKKHNLRLVPVLSSNNYSIIAQFNVEKLDKEPKTDKPADSGDKGTKK